jgi:hypothetical protein
MSRQRTRVFAEEYRKQGGDGHAMRSRDHSDNKVKRPVGHVRLPSEWLGLTLPI